MDQAGSEDSERIPSFLGLYCLDFSCLCSAGALLISLSLPSTLLYCPPAKDMWAWPLVQFCLSHHIGTSVELGRMHPVSGVLDSRQGSLVYVFVVCHFLLGCSLVLTFSHSLLSTRFPNLVLTVLNV